MYLSHPKISNKLKEGSEISKLFKENLVFIFGLIILILLGSFYVWADDGIVVNPHDQLDGEIFTYILHAEHLGASLYSELMNGIPATGMQMAAPALLVFYLLFTPVTAFSLVVFLIMLISYIGLFGLLRSFSVRSWLSAAVAFLFALLPFYSVYGLSIMGIPLLFWVVRRCWVDSATSNLVILAIVSFAFPFFSSFVLIGYAIISVFVLVFLYVLAVFRKDKQRFLKGLFVALILLIAGYCITNYELVMQVLFGAGYISHKSEYEPTAQDFSIIGVIAFLLGGQQHAISNQCIIVLFVFIGFVVSLFVLLAKRKRIETEKLSNTTENELAFLVLVCFASAVFIALFYVFFKSGMGTNLRELLPGALKAFQFDRLYWFYPAIWYLSFGASAELLIRATRREVAKKAVLVLFAVVFALTMVRSLVGNNVVSTVSEYFGIKSESWVTWEEFFAEDLFNEINNEVLIRDGKTKEGAKVVSVGLYPSIALFNGYSCLDGYSNNYSVDYKHQFGEVIANELNKSAELDDYFSKWGNRCYVFSHELGKNYLINKNTDIVITDLSINVNKLKEMGCSYIFSSVKICNASELSLQFRGRFMEEDIPYSVWVYSLN